MHGAVQAQPLCATCPQDQGRIPSPVVSCRDVALSPSILQAGESRERQGYPEVGYTGSPRAPLWSSGSPCFWRLSPRRDRSTAGCPLPCRYISASVPCRLDADGFWLRGGSGSWVPPALLGSPPHAGALRGGSAQHRSPRCSPARAGSSIPGDRFSVTAPLRGALRRPSPKG